jgi:multidrug transporter EmrE-like cation transporter
MSAASFYLVLTGVLLNATAQIMLKAGANRAGPLELHPGTLVEAFGQFASSAPILGGLACYVVSVAVWIVALTRVEVSIAYPMLSIGYVLNALAAWALFGEHLTATRFGGIALICAGVYVLARSSHG